MWEKSYFGLSVLHTQVASCVSALVVSMQHAVPMQIPTNDLSFSHQFSEMQELENVLLFKELMFISNVFYII